MKLIKINTDHYVVVDDSEIKEDCWALHMDPLGGKEIVTANGQCKLDKKITHSTIPKGMMLMEGIKRLSLQEVKELIGEVDVEKKADERYFEQAQRINDSDIRGYIVSATKGGFVDGYNQALEDNKEKKYTEEDILMLLQKIARKYFQEGREYKGNMAIAGDPLHGLRSELKELIQPKTEWEVEIVDGKLKLK